MARKFQVGMKGNRKFQKGPKGTRKGPAGRGRGRRMMGRY